MKKFNIYIMLCCIGTFFMTGCEPFDKFLDTAPDSRTDVDTPEKVSMLLVDAYPKLPTIMAELSSDNIDKRHITTATASASESLYEEIALWKDQIEDPSDSGKDIWESCYNAIATANTALQVIADEGNPYNLNPQRGEALICRAWAHFLLVNIFSPHYDKNDDTSLGIVYMETVENTVHPHYERATVKSNYEKIERDLLEALPLIDNDSYVQPKWHFNKKAAAAFASRFFLYKGEYDKVIKYATEVLTDNPESMMPSRSYWPNYGTGNTTDFATLARAYTNSAETANLMVANFNSYISRVFANYSGYGKLWSVSPYLAETELLRSYGPWGQPTSSTFYPYQWTSSSSTPTYVLIPKTLNTFHYTDLINSTGYVTATVVVFATLEILLERAEAYIMTNQFDLALADLSLWLKLWCVEEVPLNENSIETFYGKDVEDWAPAAPTIKKRVGLTFTSERQSMYFYCMAHFRRLETLYDGLRWYDVKRWKMEVIRREVDAQNEITVIDKLQPGDERFAIQIPRSVIDAGMQANKRKTNP